MVDVYVLIFVVVYGIVVGIYGNFSGTVHSRHQVSCINWRIDPLLLTDNMIDQAPRISTSSTTTKKQ